MWLGAVDRWSWWFAPWPFFILVLVYDELRKIVLRMYLGKTPPDAPSFVEQELYYWQLYLNKRDCIATYRSWIHSALTDTALSESDAKYCIYRRMFRSEHVVGFISCVLLWLTTCNIAGCIWKLRMKWRGMFLPSLFYNPVDSLKQSTWYIVLDVRPFVHKTFWFEWNLTSR